MNKSSPVLVARRLKPRRWTWGSGAKTNVILPSLPSTITKSRVLLSAHVRLVDAAEHKHCRASERVKTFYELD